MNVKCLILFSFLLLSMFALQSCADKQDTPSDLEIVGDDVLLIGENHARVGGSGNTETSGMYDETICYVGRVDYKESTCANSAPLNKSLTFARNSPTECNNHMSYVLSVFDGNGWCYEITTDCRPRTCYIFSPSF